MTKAAEKENPPGIGHNSGAMSKAERAKMMSEDKPKATGKQLKAIADLVGEHQSLTAELQALSEASSNTQAKINEITNDKLPKALREAGTSSFTDMETGAIVGLEKHLSVKWPDETEMPEENKKAMDFLKEEKAEDLIKVQVDAQFGKKEFATATKFAKELIKTGKATVQLYRGVHSATLKKWIKERMDAGKKVPMAVFSVNEFIRADVKLPKEKKAKSV